MYADEARVGYKCVFDEGHGRDRRGCRLSTGEGEGTAAGEDEYPKPKMVEMKATVARESCRLLGLE